MSLCSNLFASEDYVVLKCDLSNNSVGATIEIDFKKKVLFRDGYRYDLKDDKLYIIATRTRNDERIIINRYDLTGSMSRGSLNISMICKKLTKKL